MTTPRRAGVGVVRFYNFLTESTSFLEDALRGLAAPQKRLSPKYFYDARGSELFERICELPEYYPTRTEMALMERHVGELVRLLGADVQLIEYGSGASVKTRLLIDRLEPSLYVPVDIAEAALRGACDTLARLFPWLNITGVVADFTRAFRLPDFVGIPIRRKVVYFPGSTIGNLTLEEALDFLHNVRATVGSGGMLVIGVDLKKDRATLEAAYDDAQGVTAAFNLNVLERMNRELGADFRLDRFRHKAFYNEPKGRVEMHIESLEDQSVHVGDARFEFRRGETLHTEISCKYTVEEFRRLAREARFHSEAVWVDGAALFSVHAMMAV